MIGGTILLCLFMVMAGKSDMAFFTFLGGILFYAFGVR